MEASRIFSKATILKVVFATDPFTLLWPRPALDFWKLNLSSKIGSSYSESLSTGALKSNESLDRDSSFIFENLYLTLSSLENLLLLFLSASLDFRKAFEEFTSGSN